MRLFPLFPLFPVKNSAGERERQDYGKAAAMNDAQVLALMASFQAGGGVVPSDPPATEPAVTKAVTTVPAVAMREVASEVSTVRDPVRTETDLAPAATDDAMARQHIDRIGIPPEDVASLVKLLARRDATLDDRRSCGECAHLHRLRCTRGRCPIGGDPSDVFILHRCPAFQNNPMEAATRRRPTA
ncbi:hypothetical protein VRY85_06320 [Achromobacter sp. F4_2707]|uniref:hypothetical protein n=1 Tax=Achromobacter sp. F4_2707 TaxID=3114286 RepID=UPI0039C666AE